MCDFVFVEYFLFSRGRIYRAEVVGSLFFFLREFGICRVLWSELTWFGIFSWGLFFLVSFLFVEGFC